MKTTASEWNQIRTSFATSLMVDTPIQSLALNLDGTTWPIETNDETPAIYIDLEFVDAQWRLAERGMPASRLDDLVSILRETMAFDAPFGEMIEQTATTEARENALLKNLERMGISADFPVMLTALTPNTLEFCRREEVVTLGQFTVFAQRMALNVIVGGDFRRLLNAIAMMDEASLAELLPFRPGMKGLHLIEALAQATTAREPAAQAARVVAWFKDDLAKLEADALAHGGLARELSVLKDPFLEAQVLELLRPHCKTAMPAPKGNGLWRGILRLCGRQAA